MAPSFHALLDGAKTVGATLHTVSQHFDYGDVLQQVEVPIEETESAYSLNRHTSEAGGRMLAMFLDTFDPHTTKAVPQPAGDWNYYTYPTRDEVRRFRAKGLKFFRPEA